MDNYPCKITSRRQSILYPFEAVKQDNSDDLIYWERQVRTDIETKRIAGTKL